MNSDGALNLCAAILEEAIKDYEAALRKGNAGKITALEHFFLSEWGQTLSRDNGAEIIRRIKGKDEKTLTCKKSICVKCKNLFSYDATVKSGKDGEIKLVAKCLRYCGKNAGNRKTCKLFEQAEKEGVERRYQLFDRF